MESSTGGDNSGDHSGEQGPDRIIQQIVENPETLRELLVLFRVLEDKPVQLYAVLRSCETPGAVSDLIRHPKAAGAPLDVIMRIQERTTSALMNQVDKDLRWLEGEGHHLVVLGQLSYPSLLLEITDPPVLLFCKGKLEALNMFKIAMVGSRNPTRIGIKNANEFAQSFVRHGLAVCSGLALGIDGASHQGALNADGVTIAILGSGCDVIYPGRHRSLAEKITEQGLIVSELPLGTLAYPGNFPRRNRTVTGMSLGTLVVEAQQRSGSLISARLAMEQGREVFAIPGAISSRQSQGCNQLIRDGVTLVENVEQVLQELKSLAAFQAQQALQVQVSRAQLSSLQESLLQLLEVEPCNLDQLCERSNREVSEILANLVELEIEGLVSSDGRGYCLA